MVVMITVRANLTRLSVNFRMAMITTLRVMRVVKVPHVMSIIPREDCRLAIKTPKETPQI